MMKKKTITHQDIDEMNLKKISGAACPKCGKFQIGIANILACSCGYFDTDRYVYGRTGNLVNKHKILNANKKLERKLLIKELKQAKILDPSITLADIKNLHKTK